MWYRKARGKQKANRQLRLEYYYHTRNRRNYPQLYRGELTDTWPAIEGKIAETRTGHTSRAQYNKLERWNDRKRNLLRRITEREVTKETLIEENE